jgi:Sec-independent protein translocase protein TatA
MPIGIPEILLLVIVGVILFGSRQIPKLAQSIADARRELRASADDQAA